MDLRRWPEADSLLERALEMPRDARLAFVRQAAGGDEELVAELSAVLAEDEADSPFLRPGGALTGPLAGDLVDVTDDVEEPRLTAGRNFGQYEVTGVLGAGGMGEVYRASDSRLGRDVALKVLPRRYTSDPARRARFEREARLLAAVNDPHIGAIFGLEEHEGISALVLELVDGPTLADRLRRGPLSLHESLTVAEQIGRALVAAHARGIAHRDLKPANVKLTPGGAVKVLDFGIATVIEAPAGDAGATVDPARTAEGAGAVLGTAAYLAPERVREQAADHRADIWSFGCVLFEMLTGVRAFDGGSPTEIVARVLEAEPEFSRLPMKTPASIIRLLGRALRKEPERRLSHVGDALLEIEDARDELKGGAHLPLSVPVQRRLRWLTTIGIAAGIVIGAVGLWLATPRRTPPLQHLAIPIPAEDDLIAGELPGLAVSPDGQTVVYRTRRSNVIQLVRWSLTNGAGEVIDGSAGGASPFFSPDGQWIGFATDTALMKTPISGGPPSLITRVSGGARASWGIDDTIWFSSGTTRVIHRVPASGGTPTPVTALDTAAGDLSHDSPAISAGSSHLLMTVTRGNETFIGVANTASGQTLILTPGRQPAALDDGWFLLSRGDALFLARMNPNGALAREPRQVLSEIELGALSSTAQYAISPVGTLVYLPRRPAADNRVPVWIAADGLEQTVDIDARAYTRASVSPDGTRLALAVASPENRDIWVFEFARRTLMRLTLDAGTDTAPVWTPDGRHIAYRSERDGGGIYLTRADGSGQPVRLTSSEGPARPAHTPYSFSPDGKTLVFAELRSYTDQGIAAVSVDEPLNIGVVLDGPFAESRPSLSPDGSWLAYQSDESGRFEVYVRPFPGVTTSRVQVSTAGGSSPRWSPDGRLLYFFDGTALVSATMQGTPPIRFEAPVKLFDASRFNERLGPVYDIAPDGRQFLFLQPTGPGGEATRRDRLLLITAWRQSLP